MRYESFISLRYLRAKRKEAFISLITVFSTVGVAIGVLVLNVTLSIMTGFEDDLRDRILGFNPHVMVMSYVGMLDDHEDVGREVAQVPGVAKAEPFLWGQAILSAQQSVSGVLVRGVPPEPDATVGLEKFLKRGNVRGLAERHSVMREEGGTDAVVLPGVIVGQDLLDNLHIDLGGIVTLLSPIGTPSAVGSIPKMKRFVVAGVFRSGMSEYDGGLVYLGLEEAQRFFGAGDAVTGLEVRVSNLDDAQDVGQLVREQLGPGYKVTDWTITNKAIFNALKLEKTVYTIVLLLIILVAAFNIVATLIMVVMEKRKDIAILKSMGATSNSIRRIFIIKGAIIGLVGTALGDVGGVAVCWMLKTFRIIELDATVWPTDTLPMKMSPEFFAAVTLASLVICLLATIYPARQAARLVPVDVIRYE